MRTLGLPLATMCMTLALGLPATAKAESSPLALTALRNLTGPPALPDNAPGQPTTTTTTTTAQPEPVPVQPATAQPAPTSEPAPTPEPTMAEPPQPTSSKAPASTMQPTSSKAPSSTTPVPAPTEPEPDVAVDPVPEDDEEVTLEDDREMSGAGTAFHRHAIGAHGGIVVVPTWLLSNWLATHTNALCRGATIGAFASDRGLNQQDGCNFYVGADYAYRFSRVLDVVASVQYQRARVPDGLWLDKSRYDGSANSIEAADYTEIDLGLIAMEVDFIARAPVAITPDVEFDLGGGAGLGLGVVLGGVYQTPLGTAPEGFSNGMATPGTCQTLEDLADLTRCTPRWDPGNDGDGMPPDESQLSNPNPRLFANCTATECNENDLQAFGYRQKQGGIPPVVPVVNLILSARIIIKDAVGITLNGGFNTGFYFGGGLQVFFGKTEEDEMLKKPVEEEARRRRNRRVGRI